MTAVTEQPGSASKLPLVLLGALVAVAVLVTVALVVAGGTETFEPGTPEAALQQFIEAGLDGDETTMLALLTPQHRARCEEELDQFGRWGYDDGYRVELESVAVDGDEAELRVEFRNTNRDDVFGGSGWSFEERYDLVRVGDEWLIDRAQWPHVFGSCTRVER